MKSVFLTGPSGVGKSTIFHELTNYGFQPSPNHLTRPPRSGEVEGVDAHFIDEATFRHNFAAGEYLESSLAEAEYAGVYYGSPGQWLTEIECGETPILAIPSYVPVLKGLCNQLVDNKQRGKLLWINLSAPLETRRERIQPRVSDPVTLEKRLFAGASHGDQPEADLNIDTSLYTPQQTLGQIIFKAL